MLLPGAAIPDPQDGDMNQDSRRRPWRAAVPAAAAGSAKFRAPATAYQACAHVLPDHGQITPAEQVTLLALRFAGCMRSLW
jgi:hypothetical protein